jgi:hypothetical protein
MNWMNQNFIDNSTPSYAGIGARATPREVLVKMTDIAKELNNYGFCLNSGGAVGADQAFEQGAGTNKRIFVPKDGYNGYKMLYPVSDLCYSIASKFHPVWHILSGYEKALMARNAMQVLGSDLNSPVEFVICWTKDGCISHKTRTRETGGTGLAISIASSNGIPVFNLNDKYSYTFVYDKLLPLLKNQYQDS